MAGFPSPFGGDDNAGGLFDDYEEFVPDNIPTPGRFIEKHDVLTDDAHVEFHLLTRDVFEQRGVYDMTFGYNLAQLNLDTRHPGAGYRYAEEAENPDVLRAEFTPTTPFCPQSDTLTKGSFRAWNGLSDRHDYDLVRVRVAEMHHRSDEINEVLERLEENYSETGTVTDDSERGDSGGEDTSRGFFDEYHSKKNRDSGPEAPF